MDSSVGIVAERPGLLVVDMVRALADPGIAGSNSAGSAAAVQCRRVLDASRTTGMPVWFSRGGKRWHSSTGSPLTEVERGEWLQKNGWVRESGEQAGLTMAIAPELGPVAGEVVITKSKPSAFFATPLVSQLLAAQVDSLVVVGMMTSGCVRATVTDAFSYNLQVMIPVECLADRDAAAHKANLNDMGRKYATLWSVDELLAALRSRSASASA